MYNIQFYQQKIHIIKKIEQNKNESTNSIYFNILEDDLIQRFELDKKSNLKEKKYKLIE